MMVRVLVLGLALAACQPGAPDPIVGEWQGADAEGVARFDADGRWSSRLDAPAECELSAAQVEACARRQRWRRAGAGYALDWAGFVVRPGGLGALFDERAADGPCECRVSPLGARVDGDELILVDPESGRELERARRRAPAGG